MLLAVYTRKISHLFAWVTSRKKLVIVLAGCLLTMACIGGWAYRGLPGQRVDTGYGTPPPPPPPGGMPGGNGAPPPPPPGQSAPQNIATTAVYTQDGGTVTKSKETLEATAANTSVIKVCNSGVFTLSGSTLKKSGDTTATENSDFYGLNAAVLAESQGNITLSDCKISTTAQGANAVFATGAGSTITLKNVSITTTGRGSARGLDATFGGTVIAKNVEITTCGAHCAALATDRGEGTITVTGGRMTTSGEGSPAIYSTGNITVSNATMTATGSEAAVIEGKNSITLNNAKLVGQQKCGAMLYQSFSGDAGVGTSVFTMTGGSLMAQVGPLFYANNTRVKINLRGAALTAKSGIFLDASAGRWGQQGANGADVTLTAEKQQIVGNIICDNISTIAATFAKNTSLTGAINAKNTASSISLSLDKSSTWKVKGTSYLTCLTDADATLTNIIGNGFTIYYDARNAGNTWLAGKTYPLAKGGKLTPR